MRNMIGVFSSRQDADEVVIALRSMNISVDDISIVSPKGGDGIIENDVTGERVASGAGTGALSGGVIGALAGMIVAGGVLPGLGALFVAGPIASALGLTGVVATTAAGALTGAAAGGLIGALGSLGMNEVDAGLYEEAVRRGQHLVAVNLDNADEDRLRKLFEQGGARELRIYRS